MRRHTKARRRDWMGDFGAMLWLCAIVLLLAGSAYAGYRHFTKPIEVVALQTIVVEKEDSLWSIASRYRKDGEDIRTSEKHIVAWNKLGQPARVLQPGERLVVPDWSKVTLVSRQ